MQPQHSEERAAFRVGALVIGSLFWERERWAPAVVNFDDAVNVSAPIRYGRTSNSRGGAYTMVVSPECPVGNAKVVPFRQTASTFSDVLAAASALASAERLPGSTLSDGWGCVGLLPLNATTAALAEQWREHMHTRAKPVLAGYSEHAPIDEDAVLVPELRPANLVAFDLLLATLTTPTPPAPTPQRIADAMNALDAGSKGLRYFRENIRHGITTFQDADIVAILRARGVAI